MQFSNIIIRCSRFTTESTPLEERVVQSTPDVTDLYSKVQLNELILPNMPNFACFSG